MKLIQQLRSFSYVSHPAVEALTASQLLTFNTDGSDFMGERLVVQFARGSRRNEPYAPQERPVPRPRRTPHRMSITGLPVDTSWQVSNAPSPWFTDPFRGFLVFFTTTCCFVVLRSMVCRSSFATKQALELHMDGGPSYLAHLYFDCVTHPDKVHLSNVSIYKGQNMSSP